MAIIPASSPGALIVPVSCQSSELQLLNATTEQSRVFLIFMHALCVALAMIFAIRRTHLKCVR